MLCTAAINANTVGEDSINLDPKVLISKISIKSYQLCK